MSICRANDIALSVLVLISHFCWQPLRAELDLDLAPVDVEKEEEAKIKTKGKPDSPPRNNLQNQKYRPGHPPNPTFSIRH